MSTHNQVSFVLASTDQGTLIVNRNDFRILGQTAIGVGYQLLSKSSYDAEELVFLSWKLDDLLAQRGSGVVVVDCGANIGVHTISLATKMRSWGSVIAIEPQERLFYALCGNIALNNCTNARAIWSAVGAEVGSMQAPLPDYTKPGSFGSLELRIGETTEYIGQSISYIDREMVPVPTITIDSLCLSRLDLMKIDVEGMEEDVIRGAKETILRHKPLIFAEWIKTKREVIESLLSEFGYSKFTQVNGNILAEI